MNSHDAFAPEWHAIAAALKGDARTSAYPREMIDGHIALFVTRAVTPWRARPTKSCAIGKKMQRDQDFVPDRAVGLVLIVVSRPILQLFAGVREVHERMAFKHAARSLLLNVSMSPLSWSGFLSIRLPQSGRKML
ncbi:hypothetical protein [Breoghania sp. JC706]|uniref:hypothetical protein n=1 Tax=Breoghania sp. JC706 TaxID=3117732 RepID=UPI003009D6EC